MPSLSPRALLRAERTLFITGFVVVTALGLLDAAMHISFLGVLGLGIFIASIAASKQQVAAVGLYALLWGIWLGVGGERWTSSHLLRIAVLFACTAVALAVVRVREGLQTELVRIENVAEAAQLALLRPLDERYGAAKLAVRFVSAFEGALIGGDVYDAQATPWGLRLLVADVCGHGLEAVNKASSLVFSFREAAHSFEDLAGVTDSMEASFRRQVADTVDFASAVVMQVRGREVEIANCGHPDPILIDQEKATWLSPRERTRPFGFLNAPDVSRLTIPSRGRILLYTDGVSEARNDEKELFDLEAAVLEESNKGALDETLGAILERLRTHTGGQLRDDVVLLAVEVG